MSGRIEPLLIGCIAAVVLSTPAAATAITAVLPPDAVGQAVRGESWTDYVRALWPIFVVVGGLVATGILLGLATRFVTTSSFNALKMTVEKLETKVTSHDRRIQETESHCKLSPSPQELQEDISELGERLKGVEVGVAGLSTQANTTNTYLHMLIEKDVRR